MGVKSKNIEVQNLEIVSEDMAKQILQKAEENIEYNLKNNQELNNVILELNSIIHTMEVWSKEHKIKQQKFERRRKLNYAYVARQINVSKATGKDIRNYIQQKQKNSQEEVKLSPIFKEYNKLKQELLESYLIGFRLWFSARNYLTKQSIDYTILYSTKNNGTSKLYEAKNIKLEQFLSRANLSLDYNIKEGKEPEYRIAIISMLQDDDEVFKNEIFYSQLLGKFSNKVKNRGAIQELYLQVMQFNRFPQDRILSEKWFKDNRTWMLRQLKNRDADWSSGRAVGDIGLTQAKNISANPAHLSAIKTLPQDIESFCNAYRNRNVNDLIKLLTVDPNKENIHLDKFTKQLNKEAQNNIKELLKALN